MKKTIKILTVTVTVILMLSFADKNPDVYIGTYGVSASDPAQIILTINADRTFYYQDFYDSKKRIVVRGNWAVKGKKVVLKSNDSKTKFHNVWTFSESGQVARSRKGLMYYRLGKIN
jgi:hypothetical protein